MAPGLAPPPGTAAPPGMQQANTGQPGQAPGFPANFQPPPNMPNINFTAPVIRLGTSGPAKPAAQQETPTSGQRATDAPGGRHRAGLGGGGGAAGGAAGADNQRQNVRDTMMQLQPPTQDEIVRTIFVGGITEGTGGDEGVERILRTAGNLRRWIRATDADEKPCKFGFAEYEDPESLGTAVEVLKEVEVPVKRQVPSEEGDDNEVEKATLLVCYSFFLSFSGMNCLADWLKVIVDEGSLNYLEQYESTRSEQDPAERQAQLDAARSALSNTISDLFHPTSPTQKEDASAIDREGDTAMKDSEGQNDGTPAEVVTIPITVEDELSDIPAEMRETVAKEISAFRERSNRRDVERLKREEEIESMERARNAGSRPSRLASPPVSAPSGPAAGANGVPIGPRDRSGAPNAPSGPKGFGVQIPKDYQNGVSFVNVDREEEESDASDEELERRRQAKEDGELEKQFLDQERRWLNRERSRTAALEREKKRDKDEESKQQDARDDMNRRLQSWNDDIESTRKIDDYYADRGAWLRSRAAFRSRELSMDEADRTSEEREHARTLQQQEQARGMADDFLARQAEELETRTTQEEPPAAAAPREPQRFKLSLGAAAQKAHAATNRRTVAEVEGLLEDEEEPQATARRPLIPIKFDSAAEAAGLTEEERAQAVRQLAAEIPVDKDGLWKWDVKWEFVDEGVLSEQLKPFVEKKIVEYLGVQEQMLVDVVEEHVRQHGGPQELVEQLEEVCWPLILFLFCIVCF